MPDTFDTYQANPANVPPLVRAVCDGMPHRQGVTYGPMLADAALRAALNALAALETRVAALGG